ncbi:uncharacterized protein LY89DRAFT_487623 [Mollisia scopiformis]|uniref:C2H2-type domain-containing protein n=1 Tax=Mollisia scopiformis TaxID=149040 RepID=A0A194XGE3_MOLSC|nr:uncharacterized protein LY89DRAFT_487623 [Mollisia scopiformis]KUJ19265.1 hypothetical protein LY89DRAFT_487623 [Mollisia scopiformis]
MEASFVNQQFSPFNPETENLFDTFTDFGAYAATIGSGVNSDPQIPALLCENAARSGSRSTPISICHQTSERPNDGEAYCFGGRCLGGSFWTIKGSLETPSLTRSRRASSTVSQEPVGKDFPLFSFPNTVPPPFLRPKSSQHQCTGIQKGIKRSASQYQVHHPVDLINQLEAVIADDIKSSAEFKWKTSILFQELKRLIDREHTCADTHTHQTKMPITNPPHRRTFKKHGDKAITPDKVFHCTASPCRYSSASAPDWKRHEETHWPQGRYMCLECPVSLPAPDFPDAMQCVYCSTLSLSLEDLRLHLLNSCDSAKDRARTFNRKDKLSGHLQKDHLVTPASALMRAEKWKFEVSSNWPRYCGFCPISFRGWNERSKHLVEEHFKKGCHMGMWQPLIPLVDPLSSFNQLCSSAPWTGKNKSVAIETGASILKGIEVSNGDSRLNYPQQAPAA